MERSHKIQLKPTKEQEVYFRQACGVSRFCYNWALGEWNKQYQAGGKPSGMELKKSFNSIYKAQYPWVGDVHRDAHSQPFTNLQKAMNSFFKHINKYPKFKKKGKCKDSFYVANDKFSLNDNKVVLPVIGEIKITESLRFDGKILSASVSRSADRWFISIQVRFIDPILKPKTDNIDIGIDLGIKTSVVCSDGTTYQSPKPLRKKLRRLKRLQRSVSRKVKGSHNRYKAIKKVAKLHWRISNVRSDFLHKTTTSIICKSQACVIEDLSIKGMLSNHKLSRALSEQGLGSFRTFLEYKAISYDVKIHVVNRFFPSSKMCSNCNGIKTDLKLSDRVYKCVHCGFELDRDVNASMNLLKQLPSARGNVKPVDCQQNSIFMIEDRVKQELCGEHLCSLER